MRIPSLSLLTHGTWSPSLHPPPPRKVLLTLTFSYLYYQNDLCFFFFQIQDYSFGSDVHCKVQGYVSLPLEVTGVLSCHAQVVNKDFNTRKRQTSWSGYMSNVIVQMMNIAPVKIEVTQGYLQYFPDPQKHRKMEKTERYFGVHNLSSSLLIYVLLRLIFTLIRVS